MKNYINKIDILKDFFPALYHDYLVKKRDEDPRKQDVPDLCAEVMAHKQEAG